MHFYTLFLRCQDPSDPGRPPWPAFAVIDYAPHADPEVRFDTPAWSTRVILMAEEAGGTVTVKSPSKDDVRIRIDDWENTGSNAARLNCAMDGVHSVTVAAGLSRIAPFLDAIGCGHEAPEQLLKDL